MYIAKKIIPILMGFIFWQAEMACCRADDDKDSVWRDRANQKTKPMEVYSYSQWEQGESKGRENLQMDIRPINKLPDETLLHILKYALKSGFVDLCVIRRVNQRFRRLSDDFICAINQLEMMNPLSIKQTDCRLLKLTFIDPQKYPHVDNKFSSHPIIKHFGYQGAANLIPFKFPYLQAIDIFFGPEKPCSHQCASKIVSFFQEKNIAVCIRGHIVPPKTQNLSDIICCILEDIPIERRTLTVVGKVMEMFRGVECEYSVKCEHLDDATQEGMIIDPILKILNDDKDAVQRALPVINQLKYISDRMKILQAIAEIPNGQREEEMEKVIPQNYGETYAYLNYYASVIESVKTPVMSWEEAKKRGAKKNIQNKEVIT